MSTLVDQQVAGGEAKVEANLPVLDASYIHPFLGGAIVMKGEVDVDLAKLIQFALTKTAPGLVQDALNAALAALPKA